MPDAYAPAVLMLWRAVGLAARAGARRGAVHHGQNQAAAWRPSGTGRQSEPRPGFGRPSRRLPLVHADALPSELGGLGAGSSHGPSPDARRTVVHWAALRGRLFHGAARVALPVAAACMAVAAAATQGHVQHHRLQQHHQHSPHGGLSVAAHAARALPPHLEPPAPADVRSSRELLQAAGYGHPGLQPGAAWGAMPVEGSGGRGGPEELHPMLEYVMLFPA